MEFFKYHVDFRTLRLVFGAYSYGIHIPYKFNTLDVLNFDYQLNSKITIGTNIKQEQVIIPNMNVTVALGI